jgi:L-threonylcarbamoyladenylate synthase
MQTRYTTSPAVAAKYVKAGGLAAFPTETVYGLGARAFDARAVRSIFRAKGRPSDNPLIVHIGDRADLPRVARKTTAIARKLMDAFWPGPLTLILPKHPALPRETTAGLDTVGVRMPAHRAAREFLRQVGEPVAAPSANRSGRPSPTTWQAVRQDLDGRIPCVLKGGRAEAGLESTVVDCTGRVPIVLRAGAISLEQLRRVAPTARDATDRERATGRSPGLKYRHYAPHAQVRIARRPPSRLTQDDAWIGLRSAPAGARLTKMCKDARQYARELFHFFRRCERAGVKTIYCGAVPETGIGRALMDRLRRAASGTVPPSP